jgi:predicted nuclease of restriction endonuclease-like RecB superfamily
MLPTDLLSSRQQGETIIPLRLAIDQRHLNLAEQVIECFKSCLNQTQTELDGQLQELEGTSPDYRLKRGLAHLLRSGFSTFEVVSPLEPVELRERVFTLAATTILSPENTPKLLEKLSAQLTKELKRDVLETEIQAGLYADLKENKILTQFETPTAEALLHRYNLSQVQGIFYRANEIIIHAYRNDPGEYKLLFRYLKLFQLMTYIEGDADHGFTLTIDGPTSLFKPSTRYGLAIAKMIPALLHVTKWRLQAQLQQRDPYTKVIKQGRFTLDANCGLVSHYPPGKPYDSLLEESFAKRWKALKTEWKLEREVDLIPIPGSVMIPDFRLVHPQGSVFLLEIVGYWRPEYLKKKFYQVRQSNCANLVLAISERLNLSQAGIQLNDVPARVVWFKEKLSPKAVLAAIEP